MNKKVLGVLVSLLVVAMLALPMSVAFAEKPITRTLTGTYYNIGDTIEIFQPGESSNAIWKIRETGVVFTGDITAGDLGTWPDPTIPPVPGGVYNGNWLVKDGGPEGVYPGRYVLEDVTIVGIGTGDLTIGMWEERAIIESGSGDLRSIRGRGTVTLVVFPFVFDYEIEIKINP